MDEKQEPVAWHHPDCNGECIACLIESVVKTEYGTQGVDYLRRHVTPPQRSWQRMTDEELSLLWIDYHGDSCLPDGRIKTYERAIEQAIKEKNT
jgi:hypothetical protein